ncbi:MAG: aminopeptidase P N-terminal domain-containing protein [Gammaproteobacteria bacterium]|nr:aminopeptidase P N-terminal domain-containing protein [Gammaproteobacteria bacterium]MCH9762824.1 aminopeptidase P N-terminal domain-containing protein [Gammaproteobacteria bacterium]
MDYQARRHALARSLPADSLAIIPAASEKLRNGDSHYRFRQASDFYYLTGFNEPDAVLLLTSGEHSNSILFNRPNHEIEERWMGPRLGQAAARTVLSMDDAFSINALAERLPELLLDKHAIYYPMGRDMAFEGILRSAWSQAKGKASRLQSPPEVFADITPIVGELRLIKDASEIDYMRDAARISIAAHERVMRAAPTAQNEYELEAEFVYALGQAGCRDMAYDAIVAGGANACTLHYTANNQPLESGQLLLVDAGAEVGHYAADITRTYPINGQFSPEQRLIYELVLRAQQAGIACVKPNAPWDSIQATVVEVLTSGMLSLGLLTGDLNTLIEERAYQLFYMHSAGHWLGLDVHDVGAYRQNGNSRLLQPGMTLTVEPGIYIPEDCDAVDKKWRGIGVRIEDDILVTSDGHENLTGALAVSPDELERLVCGS